MAFPVTRGKVWLISGLKTAVLDNYVCGSCDYVESYIAKDKDLAAIRKKWELVF